MSEDKFHIEVERREHYLFYSIYFIGFARSFQGRDNWRDWKGEDIAAILSLCTKFTVVTIHVYLTKILVV